MTSRYDLAVGVLNRIHEADPSVLPQLIDFRVPCNDAIVNDSTVQVALVDDEYRVGLLGIINGLFGVRWEDGPGFIGVQMDGDGKLLCFAVLSGYEAK
jgi:hypothetical protein